MQKYPIYRLYAKVYQKCKICKICIIIPYIVVAKGVIVQHKLGAEAAESSLCPRI